MRTQHFADVGFNVHVLQVLVGVSVEQAQGGVQADGHPDAVADPGQLPHLALLAGVSVEGLLLQGHAQDSECKLQRRFCGNLTEVTGSGLTSILMALGWMT